MHDKQFQKEFFFKFQIDNHSKNKHWEFFSLLDFVNQLIDVWKEVATTTLFLLLVVPGSHFFLAVLCSRFVGKVRPPPSFYPNTDSRPLVEIKSHFSL